MFVARYNKKVVCVGETENDFDGLTFDEMVEDTEHSVSDYMQVNGEYVLTSSDEAIEQKKADVRVVRNSYLVKYVDPKQLVLVWGSLTEDEQKEYTDYRRYLLDYPETEDWFEHSPMTFEEWRVI